MPLRVSDTEEYTMTYLKLEIYIYFYLIIFFNHKYGGWASCPASRMHTYTNVKLFFFFFMARHFFIARDSMEFSLTVGERLSSIIIIFF
jgi:hypothetical protein